MNNNTDSDFLFAEVNPEPSETDGITETAVKLRRPRRDKRNKIILIVLLCVLGAGIIAGGIFGAIKLFYKAPYDNTAQFYFASDLLSEQGGEYTVYGNIDFTVCNYADALRTSAGDIENYSVTISSDGKNITNDCDITSDTETMPAGHKTTGAVSITVPEEYYDTPLDVTVVSEPINVELRGSFTVLPVWSGSYTDSENSVNGCLTLSANEETTVYVKWDTEKLIADSTNAYVKASDTAGECYVTLAAGTSTQIYFFKPDITAVYSLDGKDSPFTVEKSDKKAVAADTAEETTAKGAETSGEGDE